VGLDWTGLSSGMDGSLVLPGSPAFAQASMVVNRRYESVLPQAVARCATPDDVKEVLAFARKNKLPVAPRSGGHSFGGYSTSTGVIIDVTPMNGIQLHGDGTATIGAGARLADIYDQLTAQGVAIPSGSCPSVGIAGITQGGGIGFVDRKYGLTCDNLVSAQVVTADGRLLTCSDSSDPDLFWALRGGGGGNFGVVTSFTFKTHATQDLTEFFAGFNYSDMARVLAAWQAWQHALPDETWSFLITSFFDTTQAPNVLLYGVHVGPQAEFAPYWSQFLSAAGVAPTYSGVSMRPYRDIMLSGCAGLTISQCHMQGQTPDAQIRPYYFASTSDFYDHLLPAEGIDAFLQGIDTAHSSGLTGQVLLDSMGGALGRVAPDATAFVHRNALFSAEYYLDAPPGKPATWHHDMRTRMKPWSSGRAYVNYIDPMIDDWGAAYYGSNFAKLVQAKAAYDPEQVFKFAQGVPVSL
jgi:FAD/FMN-containing dehydrogenase